MINSQKLIDKICTKISSGGLTSVETCQTTNALTILSNPVVSVTTYSSLPSVSLYAGRMIYVNDENRYYYSTGYNWINDFSSDTSSIGLDVIWAIGQNNNSKLGDGTTTNRSSPVSVVGGFTDWCQVSAGGEHSLGLRTNGTVWAWGCNAAGTLGDGTVTCKSSPVSVVGGFTDWCRVSTGCVHSLAIRSNGTLWGWGGNGCGILGDGTVVGKCSPVSVVGGFTDWCQVSAGLCHSLAVRTDGTAWAWGNNTNGRLGDNTITNRSSPISVIGGFTNWCQVSAGCVHSLGLRSNGTAWAWGCNAAGQLGDNSVTSRASPVSVVGGFTDWCQISAGGTHSFGLRTNGTAWAWGNATIGRLGDGQAVTNRSSPVSIVGGFTDWCQICATSNASSFGIRTNGTLWAWGSNGAGQLGQGNIGDKDVPTVVIGGFTEWCQVSGGNLHTLTLIRKTKGL
jgi:hypothetical protein